MVALTLNLGTTGVLISP